MSFGRNVCLIGYRGTGKTTVGRILAERLGYRYIDTDDEIEKRAGRTIADIFRDQGEGAFRDLESTVIADVVQPSQLVLSLGGGAILRPENRQRIQECGVVVWLRAPLETIAERMGLDPHTEDRRPKLTEHGTLDEINAVLQERWPLYQACASISVDTDGRSPQAVVDLIVEQCALDAG